MAYCLACGYDDQWTEDSYMPCQRCGAERYPDGSVSVDGSREGRRDAEEQMREFDERQERAGR